ncbi:LysR family transcriptional regulator [Actinomadura rupiterrae]|uniref:LysR family transcriptional regulator n=1 Tax=Actinomadura rupiterrae TaxID=559627 RepID=UPI0020A57C4F|nr:LysR family transcriptional regulator [Actinomadura rupiterrae]MCP2336335.1 DNA-binding transcriptional LysR family regulator [Actinomadura rupiterrae]
MTDMREIEAFLTVCEEVHFGRAAERLGLSTSRVSFLVKRLERRLGARLFERTSRRVGLTEQGEYLFAEIRPATVRIERALADVSAWSGRRREILRVGFATTLLETMAADLTAAFERRHPECRVVQSTHPAAEMLRWLGRDWNVDVMVTWMPGEPALLAVPGLEAGPVIWRQPRGVALAADHPLADRPALDVEELADHEVLSFVGIPQGYADAWTPPVTPAGRAMSLRRVRATYVEEMIRMVAEDGVAHLTFTSLPDRYQVPGVVMVPVIGLPPMTVAAMWPGTTTRHPLAPAFAQAAFARSVEAGWPVGADRDGGRPDRHPSRL